jgi:hypothetical protein
MDDSEPGLGTQNSMGFAKERRSFLKVKDVEEHRILTRGIGEARSFDEKIARGNDDVGDAASLCFSPHPLCHLRVDVKCMNDTATLSGRCKRESAIATAKFDDVTRAISEFEEVKHFIGMEESFPLLFIGHPAFSCLHLRSPVVTAILQSDVVSATSWNDNSSA